MPQEWNNKIAVKAHELIPLFFSSEQVLCNKIYKDKSKPNGIKKLQSGGNGRELLIDFDSLDLSIKNALGDPRKVTNWMDKFYAYSYEVEGFYAAHRLKLDREHIREYTINACTLKAASMLKAARTNERISKRGSLRGIPTTVWQDCMGFRAIQKMKYGYEHSLPNNERRFLEALRQYECEGLESVVSKKHGNKNAVKVTADVIEILNNLFAGRMIKPSPTMVHREYLRFLAGDIEVEHNDTAEVISPVGYPMIDDRTVLGYLARWENKIGTWDKRAGDKMRYKNQFKITHRFNPAKMAGSILSVDDRNPPFVLPNGKRVWFYIGIDLASEAFTTYVHGTTKEGIIEEFYRQLVRDYASYGVGLPLELECESALNSGLRDTILEDGALFKKVRVEKNNPTGKMIENYFRRLRYGLEKYEEGWQGRPFAKNEANQTNTEKPIHKSFDEIVSTTKRIMQEWNEAEHPRVKGKTRWEVFLENQNPECKPIDWNVVLPRIGKETTTSCRVGYVNLNSTEWCIGQKGKLSTGDELINAMKRIEGKKLTVRWLDDDEGKVIKALAYKDERFECELVEVPRYSKALFERTEADFEAQTYMSAYANTVSGFAKVQRNAIAKVTVIERKKQVIEERVVEVLEEIEEEEFVPVMSYKKPTMWERY